MITGRINQVNIINVFFFEKKERNSFFFPEKKLNIVFTFVMIDFKKNNLL